MDQFILVKKNFKQAAEPYPKVRIDQSAYAFLAECAVTTGLSLARLASAAIKYASEHVEFIEEE